MFTFPIFDLYINCKYYNFHSELFTLNLQHVNIRDKSKNGKVHMELGTKVIFNSEIHFIFFDHGNGLCEIQSRKTNAISLARTSDLIYVIK